jgi:hypothetical protein
MKRHRKWMILIAIGVILAGCVLPAKEIARMTNSTRTDVFVEVPAEGNAPAGFVDLVIKASIKTPLEGYYILEPKESMRGKPGYPFLVNIDGQAALWTGDGQKKSIPLYDENGKTSRDPDAGVGMKYTLEKRVGLVAGVHKVFFALPGDDCFIEADVTVKEGEQAVLEFKPVYKYKTFPTRIPTFLKGIKQYEVYLNGEKIRWRSG